MCIICYNVTNVCVCIYMLHIMFNAVLINSLTSKKIYIDMVYHSVAEVCSLKKKCFFKECT